MHSLLCDEITRLGSAIIARCRNLLMPECSSCCKSECLSARALIPLFTAFFSSLSAQVDKADVSSMDLQYTYDDGENFVFMNSEYVRPLSLRRQERVQGTQFF